MGSNPILSAKPPSYFMKGACWVIETANNKGQTTINDALIKNVDCPLFTNFPLS